MSGDRPRDRGVSRRENEVLALVRANLSNAEIATRLYISERTVESHVTSLLRKFGARDRHELARIQDAQDDVPAVSDAVRQASGLPPTLALLADAATFVGRRSERQQLHEQWRLACTGHTVFVALTGKAGIGKSRLVAELAVEVVADGGRVLLGACHEGVDEPYGPFAQIIAADAADLAEAEIARRLGNDRALPSRLAPALARTPAVDRAGEQREADESERSLVLDSIEGWLAASASITPLLVVVEDLHWAGSSTRQVVRHLMGRSSPRPLLILVTARAGPPDLDSDLSGLLADLTRFSAVSRLSLRGLAADEAAMLSAGNPIAVAELAPLRMVDAVPGNLPVQTTSFVGREVAVKEVSEQVRAHRLVTLTGVGGVGKTRLAMQVAAELTGEFPDGVWLVEFAPVGDPAAVPDTLAAVLGVTPHADVSVTVSVAQALSGRRLLLVLDNCEHVLGRRRRHRRASPRPHRHREGDRHQPGRPPAGIRAPVAGSVARRRRGRVGGGGVVRRTGHGREPGVPFGHRDGHRCGDRDLPRVGRHRAGHRVGGSTHGVDERRGCPRSSR